MGNDDGRFGYRDALVGFVADYDEAFALTTRLDFFLLFGGGFLVEEPEDDACSADGLVGAVNAYLLDGVGGLSDAGGVDESEGNALDVDNVLDGVARGTMDVADDGSVVVQQAVEQC